MDLELITKQSYSAAKELIERANMKPGQVLLIGCSTSEVQGFDLGSHSGPEIGKAILDGILTAAKERNVFLAAQCCEHINRAVILEEAAMEKYAKECRELARSAGAYVDNKYLGEPTDEPPIRAFRAIHAKCYAMEEWDKDVNDYQLKVVIAGIPKSAIKWKKGKPIEKTNAEELGSIDNLKDGFIFKHCGGTRCVYNEDQIKTATIDGHKTEYASSAIIENIEKEISDTMYTKGKDYAALKIVQDALD